MKYEFGSRPWFAALHAIICEKVHAAAKPDFVYSLCEVFTNVPAHLAFLPGDKAAWHAAIRGTDVTFELEESDDVDFKAVVDYTSALPLARYDTGSRPERAAELQSLSKALIADGRMSMKGSSADTGGALAALHDSIVRLTA